MAVVHTGLPCLAVLASRSDPAHYGGGPDHPPLRRLRPVIPHWRLQLQRRRQLATYTRSINWRKAFSAQYKRESLTPIMRACYPAAEFAPVPAGAASPENRPGANRRMLYTDPCCSASWASTRPAQGANLYPVPRQPTPVNTEAAPGTGPRMKSSSATRS